MMKHLLFMAFLFFSSFTFAKSDFQNWTGVFLEKPVSQRWSLFGEVQNRIYHNASTERMLIARAAANYQITPRHTVALGYGWTPTFHPTFLDEHRLWQQSLARFTLGDFTSAFRFRLEQRIIGGVGVAWRWREQIRFAYKVSDSITPVIWDEFFFNLNRTSNVAVSGFAQNRLFLGARFELGETWSVEPGYMNVIQRNAGGVENEMNHVATIYFFFKGKLEEADDQPQGH